MKDTIETRQSIIDACRFLRDNGYMFSTWGNISLRLDDGNILITPTKVDYDEMTPEDLPVLAPDGQVVSGSRLATSERELHRALLNRRPDMNAAVHVHSPCATAMCVTDGGIPAITEEMAQLLNGAVRVSSKFVPSDSHKELAEAVAGSIGDANAILIRNHGPICLGRNLAEAVTSCQVVEKSAKLYISLLAAGLKINALTDEAIARGRDYFLHGYGKS